MKMPYFLDNSFNERTANYWDFWEFLLFSSYFWGNLFTSEKNKGKIKKAHCCINVQKYLENYHFLFLFINFFGDWQLDFVYAIVNSPNISLVFPLTKGK